MKVNFVFIAVGLTWLGLGNVCRAQTAPADLSPDVQEVLTLSHQHMDDSVITNYIISTGKTYKLSADDIIYLNSQGVSQGVITALLQTSANNANAQNAAPAAPSAPSPEPPPLDSSAPASAPSAPSAPPVAVVTAAPAVPPTPDLGYFQQQLSPYGTWVTVPGYGLCWEPAVWPGWRPYYDGGHWEYTDAGYFWQSDYPWGDIAFHYGRWAYVNLGVAPCWVWVPGYDYAPAWVVWRHDDADGYVGWAPLPPGAVFVNGDWFFHGARVGVDFDFGLGVGFFTFVGYDHFWAHDYRQWVVPHDRVDYAYHHSAMINHYGYEHGVFVNTGVPHDRMAVYTHNDFHPKPMADLRHDEEMHNAMQRRDDIHNFRPGAQPNATGHGGGQNGHQNGWGH